MKRDLIVSAMFYHNMQDFVLVLEENLLNGVIEISAVSSLLIYAAEFVQSFIWWILSRVFTIAYHKTLVEVLCF